MADLLNSIDAPCPQCAKTLGDHTLRQINACFGTRNVVQPYVDHDQAQRALLERVGLPEGTYIADHVQARAAVWDTGVSKVPCVLLDFAASPAVAEPGTRVAYLGDLDSIRGFGRLIRDASNGAANAAKAAINHG